MSKHKLSVRLSVILVAITVLVGFMPISALIPQRASAKTLAGNTSTDMYLQRAREFFNTQLKKLADTTANPDEVIRVLVEFEASAVAESLDGLEYTEEARKAEEAALAGQAAVIAKVEALTGNRVINQTAYLFNGFSIEMKRSQMAAVAALDGVKSVSPVSVFHQDMTTAVQMTTAPDLWAEKNGGYTGEGIVISIIDSGVNYEHPDMKLDDDAKVKFTEEQMAEKIKELGYGKYYTEKVPFGYSYAGTASGDINNAQVPHGLHVSGIAAANGGILGVAPNAQIFGMQVFSESGSGYNDDIIKAVEDSVKLGADVINMSLGGGPGFYDDADYLQTALGYAEANGIVCCIAAGNDGQAGSYYGEDTNEWALHDTGMVSNPSTYPGAVSIASVDNSYQLGSVLDIYADGDAVVTSYAAWDFSSGAASNWTGLGETTLVDCGLGYPQSITAPESGSWVALIQRGDITFEEKIGNAVNAGASAVIIYNNELTDEIPGNLGAGAYANVRAISISGNLGQVLLRLAASGAVFTFNGFKTASVPTDAPMSFFSSWGPTPTLDIKPELTAPGGNIYSTYVGDSYGYMSGTSMATPYASGATAIVLQALKDAVEKGTLVLPEGVLLNEFTKKSMMNTANPLMSSTGIYPVRQQGAGLVDPLGAANNRVLATYKADGLAGIALKEVSQGKTNFVIVLTNYGTEEASYELPIYTPVYTDYIDASGAYYDIPMEDALITFDETDVTVPAGESVEIHATLTVGRDAEKDRYVEAFITLGGKVELSIPVLGYYGDWVEADRIVDQPAYEEDNFFFNYYYDLYEAAGFQAAYGAPFPYATWLVGSDANGGSFLGMLGSDNYDLANPDPERLVFSPNGDGLFDDLAILGGMIRNAGSITVDILNADKEVIRRINTLSNVSKTGGYDAYNNGYVYTLLSNNTTGDGTWDGTVFDPATGEYVDAPEGQYYVSIKASLPCSDKVEETILPIKLDVTAPEVNVVSVKPVQTEEGMTLAVQFTVKDDSPIASSIFIFVNGSTVDPSNCEKSYDEKTGIYTYVVPAWIAGSFYKNGQLNEIAVVADDYGQNEGIDIFYTDVYFETPVLFSNVDLSPELVTLQDLVYDTYMNPDGTNSYENVIAEFRGVVTNAVKKLTINGVEAQFDKRNGFVVHVPVDLGYGTLTVEATDADGKVIYSLEKDIVVDLGAPIITGWVTDEDHSGVWDVSHVLCSHDAGMGGWTFATTYGEEDLVPITLNIDDQMIDTVQVKWFTGDISSPEFDAIMMVDFMGFPAFFMPDYPTWKTTTETFTEEDIVNGQIQMDMPFFTQRAAEWNYEIPYDYAQQFVCITATDKAGNRSSWILTLIGGALAEQEAIEYGYYDLRQGSGMVNIDQANFETLDPIWDGEGLMPEYAVVTPEMVDENGVLHLSGRLNKDVIEVRYGGEYYDVVEAEDGTKTSGFDVKLSPGLNVLYYTTSTNILDMTWRVLLYYYPENAETAVSFENEEIKPGAVIYTNEDVFSVDGSISTIVGGIVLSINGDMIYGGTPAGVTMNGAKRTVDFDYSVMLQDGENYISFAMKDAGETYVYVDFVVVKDTVAPSAPEITADEDGNVTVDPEEEGVTVYYSLDGETWILYEGTFALETSGKVYVKAVDAAGNESAVISIDVTVPEPTEEPSEPTEEPTQKPDEPTQKPDEPTQKPDEPTQKPDEPTQKPDEPTQKPDEPTQKPDEPTDQPSNPTEPGTPDTPDNPPTGQNGSILFLMMLLVVGAAFSRFVTDGKRAARK